MVSELFHIFASSNNKRTTTMDRIVRLTEDEVKALAFAIHLRLDEIRGYHLNEEYHLQNVLSRLEKKSK